MWLEVMERCDIDYAPADCLGPPIYSDLPQKEVARLMRVSRGTVASTLADAKRVRNHESTPPGKW